MIKKVIEVDRNHTVSVNGLKKTVHVKGQQEIDWPETLEDCVKLFGSEKAVLEKVREIYRIRKQDTLARKLALQQVAPERALLAEKREQVKKLVQTMTEKGLSIEDIEKLIASL